MRLRDVELRPGFVTQVVDEFGTIKARVAGLFDEDDNDKVPPITPFGSFSRGNFSSPEVGDEIMVFYDSTNPQYLKYIRQNTINKDLSDILKREHDKCEVVMRRARGLDFAQLYFSDGEGWVLQDNLSAIRIKPDGTINISTGDPNRTLEINPQGISLGSAEKSSEPAVLGDKLMTTMSELTMMMRMVSQAAKANPYTTGIASAIDAKIESIENNLQTILSNNVTLD